MSLIVDGIELEGRSEYGHATTSTAEGLWDAPDSKDQDDEYVDRDGSSATEQAYASRVVTVEGNFHVDSHERMHEAMDAVRHIGARGPFEVHLSGHGDPVWGMAKRRMARATPITDRLFRFQVGFKMPDPRWLGHPHSFSARVGTPVQVFHHGRYSGPLTLTVNGRSDLFQGWVAYGPGSRRFRVTRAATSVPHVVDLEQGTLTIGGVPYFGEVLATQSDTWSVAPGAPQTMNVLPWPTSDSSMATYTLTTYDAWI